MDDMIFFECLKIAEWKTNKFQHIYDSELDRIIRDFKKYIEENGHGEIDIKNKSIDIKNSDLKDSRV